MAVKMAAETFNNSCHFTYCICHFLDRKSIANISIIGLLTNNSEIKVPKNCSLPGQLKTNVDEMCVLQNNSHNILLNFLLLFHLQVRPFFIIDWFTDPPTLLFGKLK